jgi:glycosyltransferase involved in cell wall biosynthesis
MTEGQSANQPEIDSELLKLVVMIPAFNEEERVGQAVAAIREEKENLRKAGYDQHVYVIDDGSTDKTLEICRGADIDRIVRHKLNQGLGAAVRSGLKAAHQDGADIVVKFDADLQHDPKDIADLVLPIKDDTADVVYGNRFERIDYDMPFVRKVGNKVFTGLMRWLTKWPLQDSQPGIFAVNTSYLSVFHLPGDYNYTQQVLLDAYHKGMRFDHASVAFRKRETGKSFISMKYPFRVIPQIIMVLVSVRPMRIFGTIGLLFILLGASVFIAEIGIWALADAAKPVRSVNLVMGSMLFGLQTLFFGILAQLIVEMKKSG